MRNLGNYVSAESEGKGEEDFDLMGLDPPHQLRRNKGCGNSHGHGATGFDHEQQRDVPGSWGIAAGNFEYRDEQDRADSVVEKGFAGQLRLNTFRNADAPEHFENCDRISRGNESSEEEALDPWNMAASE